MKLKGIILAGGSGSRLYPSTLATSKQLLPVYNKPLIYYPLCTLMEAGIKDILIITTKDDIPRFKNVLKDGTQFGINLYYEVQDSPKGIADAFLIGETFIGEHSTVLILGDNIFHGSNLSIEISNFSGKGAKIFGAIVDDPERYGILELDDTGKAKKIIEKPVEPKSNIAITGLYCFDNSVISLAKELQPSDRGELEITDLNNLYLDKNLLDIHILDNEFNWIDTGTHESLSNAAQYVQSIESRQGYLIASPEITAKNKGWIDELDCKKFIDFYANSSYGKYLKKGFDL